MPRPKKSSRRKKKKKNDEKSVVSINQESTLISNLKNDKNNETSSVSTSGDHSVETNSNMETDGQVNENDQTNVNTTITNDQTNGNTTIANNQTNGNTTIANDQTNGNTPITTSEVEMGESSKSVSSVVQKVSFEELRGYIRRGDLEGLKTLELNGGDIHVVEYKHRWTLLHCAAYYGQLETCQYLHDAGIDIGVRASPGTTPLMSACRGGDISVVKWMLTLGCDVHATDNYGQSTLHLAVNCGQIEMAQYLLTLRLQLQHRDKDGETLLHTACRGGDVPTVKWLLHEKCDLNDLDNVGQTPFHKAAEKGHLELCDFLYSEHNIDLEVTDNEGKTPLMLASSKQQLSVIKWLMSTGADPNRKDNTGKSAYAFLNNSEGNVSALAKFVVEQFFPKTGDVETMSQSSIGDYPQLEKYLNDIIWNRKEDTKEIDQFPGKVKIKTQGCSASDANTIESLDDCTSAFTAKESPMALPCSCEAQVKELKGEINQLKIENKNLKDSTKVLQDKTERHDEQISKLYELMSQTKKAGCDAAKINRNTQHCQTNSTILQNIWERGENVAPKFHFGSLNGNNISMSSICSLRPGADMSDEVISSIGHIFGKNATNKDTVKIIDTFIMTSIVVDGTYDRQIIKDEEKCLVERVFGVINEGHHWCLIYADLKNKKFMYVNPLGESERVAQNHLQNWNKYMSSLGIEQFEQAFMNGHARQKDSTSCGVYSLKFLEILLNGENRCQEIDVGEESRRMAMMILQNVENSGTRCHNCTDRGDDNDWFPCESCFRWFHLSCFSQMEIETGTQSKCYLCSLNFVKCKHPENNSTVSFQQDHMGAKVRSPPDAVGGSQIRTATVNNIPSALQIQDVAHSNTNYTLRNQAEHVPTTTAAPRFHTSETTMKDIEERMVNLEVNQKSIIASKKILAEDLRSKIPSGVDQKEEVSTNKFEGTGILAFIPERDIKLSIRDTKSPTDLALNFLRQMFSYNTLAQHSAMGKGKDGKPALDPDKIKSIISCVQLVHPDVLRSRLVSAINQACTDARKPSKQKNKQPPSSAKGPPPKKAKDSDSNTGMQSISDFIDGEMNQIQFQNAGVETAAIQLGQPSTSQILTFGPVPLTEARSTNPGSMQVNQFPLIPSSSENPINISGNICSQIELSSTSLSNVPVSNLSLTEASSTCLGNVPTNNIPPSEANSVTPGNRFTPTEASSTTNLNKPASHSPPVEEGSSNPGIISDYDEILDFVDKIN